MKISRVVYTTGMPKLKINESFLIYDRAILKNNKASVWLKKFPNKMSVKAGEELKSIESYASVTSKLLEKWTPGQTIVVVGGGSVGDFGGFIASTLKRGVPLIHIPSTWLAAIDSSHGGKTALNIGSYKNQVGSYYPANEVILSKALLSSQPDKNVRAAYGELLKISVINGGRLWSRVSSEKNLNINSLWKILPEAIAAKLKIVKKDPYEKKRIRQLLNLGHSFGHVLELNKNWMHGEAVLAGLHFSLHWSLEKKYISYSDFLKVQKRCDFVGFKKTKLKMSEIQKALKQDKKLVSNDEINFVFIQRPGKCKLRKVKLSELTGEARRQGWVG